MSVLFGMKVSTVISASRWRPVAGGAAAQIHTAGEAHRHTVELRDGWPPTKWYPQEACDRAKCSHQETAVGQQRSRAVQRLGLPRSAVSMLLCA
jgi:hypothetical protein